MFTVISAVIQSVLGLVLNKARNTAIDKLKERGDVTDEKLRTVIIEDLNDIKTKIDGLARKDLLASYSFLKEGIISLNVALDEAIDEHINKHEVNIYQDGGSKTTETTTRNESEFGVLNEAIELSNAIQKLNNSSDGRFIDAKECFKAAREKATEAFCNEALSLPDRIMATKLRVVSKILECFRNAKVAVAGCMLFLEELHNLPGTGETFSTYFKGGIKSRVYKDLRLENVKSVLSLNFAVSEFIARFSGELPNVGNWPRIHLPTKGETIHPLVIHSEVLKEIFDNEEFKPPENHVLTSLNERDLRCYVVNSNGELLVVKENVIITINRSGDTKKFCELRQDTVNLKSVTEVVKALAIDRYDNIIVIIKFKDEDVYVLFLFDSSGDKKHERLLDFLELDGLPKIVNCGVNNDGEILIHVKWSDCLYVCDRTGALKSRLPLEESPSYHSGDFISLQCVTDQNELVTCTIRNVLVFTREGKLKRTIKAEHVNGNVTYNHLTSKIEIVAEKNSRIGTTTSFSILSYSENDEVERLYVPVKNWMIFPKIFHHSGGPGAVRIYQNYQGHDSSIVFM